MRAAAKRGRRWGRLTVAAAMLVGSLAVAAGCTEDSRPKKAKPTSPKKQKHALDSLRERLGEAGEQAQMAGCVVATPAAGSADHVDSTDGVKYSSDPPSSGQHFPDWAAFGFFDEVVEDGYVVHNMEHGGVALWYGPDALNEARTKIVRDDVLDDKEKWIVVPRPKLDGIALAAWGMLMTCSQTSLENLDDKQFEAVLDEWYEATNSRGTDQEKNVPAFAGALPEPQPERDISREPG